MRYFRVHIALFVIALTVVVVLSCQAHSGRGQSQDPKADSRVKHSFAAALACWQEKTGLGPTGILDDVSLNAMVSDWQRSRLKNRELAQPDQLVTGPASDFYDPERAAELRQVERETYAAQAAFPNPQSSI